METVLYTFMNFGDGGHPGYGDVFLDGGNIYGTTMTGGYGDGVAYEVTPSGSETPIYSFSGPDGAHPQNGVIGNAGNLYGTTYLGGGSGCDCGTVFQLIHSIGWTEMLLYSFQNGE
jgi:uncharacterized repeat protein (TIGR03803 family)